jgi:murein DD-endopeptidase MepM/ murein hydrolase activator NlpD
MSKNSKVFTFLFAHSTKSRIFIKRVEVSKKHLQHSILSLALLVFFTSLAISIAGVVSLTEPGNREISSSLIRPAVAQIPTQQLSINYSRPDVVNDFSVNSGGPVDADNTEDADAVIEKQLQVIQTTSDASTIPSIWAHAGKINNEFGFRRNPFGGRTYEFHAGMDIDGERGDIVVAPAGGIVTKAGWQGGYGNMIEIDHGNGLITRYGHLSKIEVEVGNRLSRGELMGFVGSTGRSTGPHLHYELRLNDKPINPRRFLPPEPTELAKLN